MLKDKSENSKGFTLIEIIIAVMILSISLITLLGLQSSATEIALRTRNKQEAMLASRALMSAIEYSSSDIENQKAKGPVSEVAQRFLNKEAIAPLVAQEQKLPLTANLTIEYWPIAGLPENRVQRITLIVAWSDNPADSLTTYYFIPRQN